MYVPNPVAALVLAIIGAAATVASTAAGIALSVRQRREQREAREAMTVLPVAADEIRMVGMEAARVYDNYDEARRALIDLLINRRQGRSNPVGDEEDVFRQAFEDEKAVIAEEERLIAIQREAERRLRRAERQQEAAARKQAAYEQLEVLRQEAARARAAEAASRVVSSPLVPIAAVVGLLTVGYLVYRRLR